MCVLFLLLDIALNDTTEAGAVRLVGGNTLLEGRVEVFLLGQWGTVCDYNWDLRDATVVCRQLGYLRAVEAPRSAAFGAGSGPSWYYYVTCTGTEMNLNECVKSVSSLGNFCTHSLDAGVRCSSKFSHTVGTNHIQLPQGPASSKVYGCLKCCRPITKGPQPTIGCAICFCSHFTFLHSFPFPLVAY